MERCADVAVKRAAAYKSVEPSARLSVVNGQDALIIRLAGLKGGKRSQEDGGSEKEKEKKSQEEELSSYSWMEAMCCGLTRA